MPRTVDDVEQDEAPRDKTTNRALNTRRTDNQTRETTDPDTAEELANNRSDRDGGHVRGGETSSGGNTSGGASSGGASSGGGSGQQSSSNSDTAIGDFINNLFGNTSGGSGSGGSGSGGSGSGGSGSGGSGSGSDEDPPKDDSFIDNPPNDEENTGTDRQGQFGSGSQSDPPKEDEKVSINFSRRNRSQGVTVTYKGSTYTVDTKGTESTADMGGAEEWLDDTFTVGSTVINLSEFASKTESERLQIMKSALGESDVPSNNENLNSTKKLNVLGIFWIVKRDSKYGAVVSIADPDDTKKSIFFDDSGNITVKGVTYTAKEVFYENESIVNWLKKQVDDTKSEELAALYAGWGFTPTVSNQETPSDANPATNPSNPEQKFEAKEKTQESPQGAPPNVENSKAQTTARAREIQNKLDAPKKHMRISNYFLPLTSNPPKKGPNWGYRSHGTQGKGLAENELNVVESKIIHSVKRHLNAYTWKELVKKPILGVDVPANAELTKIIDYPIIMNFPEVGIPNPIIPYIAENQTEQHRLVKVNAGAAPTGTYGIGTDNQTANWAELHHWCGMFTKHATEHGGYKPVVEGWSWWRANAPTIGYSQVLPNPITKDTEGSYGNLPMFINPETNNWELDPEFYKMGSPSSGEKSAREYNKMYKFYKQTKIVKQREVQETVIKKGKAKIKTKMVKDEIPIKVYESLLPNPISIYFIAGVHFDSKGLTDMGKKLMEHFLSQRGWEASIITRGTHIEMCPYLNPDGSLWRIGGNTSQGTVKGDGGDFACEVGHIWSFAGIKAGQHIAFHKLTPRSEYQKIEPTMNGIFRRTELVDSYYKAVANGDSKVLKTLKNSLYDQIVDPG
jgi:hypothetical protein